MRAGRVGRQGPDLSLGNGRGLPLRRGVTEGLNFACNMRCGKRGRMLSLELHYSDGSAELP